MIPKDCKRLAEVDFRSPRCRGTRRGRSAMKASGRGTNRAIGMCAKPGAPPPVFEKKQRLLVVTFKSPLGVGGWQGVTRDPATGTLAGGADPRRDGYSIAY